jgi:hypothetical protein
MEDPGQKHEISCSALVLAALQHVCNHSPFTFLTFLGHDKEWGRRQNFSSFWGSACRFKIQEFFHKVGSNEIFGRAFWVRLSGSFLSLGLRHLLLFLSAGLVGLILLLEKICLGACLINFGVTAVIVGVTVASC